MRLLQQPLGLHRGLDRVEHDADAGGELFEERDLQVREGADRRQLDNGLDLTLEQDRQRDDVARRNLEQRRADRSEERRVGKECKYRRAPKPQQNEVTTEV